MYSHSIFNFLAQAEPETLGTGTGTDNQDFFQQVWEGSRQLISDSPQLLICVVILFLLGYGISFLVFSYRRNTTANVSNNFHLIMGLAYVALVFTLRNWRLVLQSNQVNLDHIIRELPQTFVISLALFFIVAVPVTIYRESRK